MSDPTQHHRCPPHMPQALPLATRPPPRHPPAAQAPLQIYTDASLPWQTTSSNITAQYPKPSGMSQDERPPPRLFRPDSGEPIAPPSSYRFNVPSTYLAQSPGPELTPSKPLSSRPPSSKYPSGRPKLDPRISQYSASMYSVGEPSPTGSPNVVHMPTFADMQASLAKKGLHNQAQQHEVTSCYEPEHSFADSAVPVRLSHQSYVTSSRDSVSSDSTYSGQFNLYIPEKDGVISPLSGEAKGMDSGMSPVNWNDSMKPLALFNHQPKAYLTPVEEKSEPHYSMSAVPELGTRSSTPPSHESAIASSAALVPEPLKTPKSVKSSSRSASPHSLHVKKMAAVRTPSPRPVDNPFDDASILSSGSSRTRSPLIGDDIRSQPSPTPFAGKLFLPPQRKKSLRDGQNRKQPAHIDVDAVRQAEAHGSLTSLPGLINRALNMASNLEHGKTSSRQSDWFGNDLIQELTKKGKSTASLGQVLEGFTFSPAVVQRPSGGIGNGFDGASHTSGNTSLSEKFNHLHQQNFNQNVHYASEPPHLSNRSRSKYDYRGGPRQRKCCGMPLWIFLLILTGAVTIITLAIALPLALLGGKQNKKDDSTDCAAAHPCQNGGASVPGPNNTCSCVCVDNFTGSNCSKSNSAASCGSVQTSTVADATIGSQLVSLFNNGGSQFLVPLNASIVLPIFSANNLTCNMENALVAVGSAAKLGKRSAVPKPVAKAASTTLALRARTTASPNIPVGEPLRRRQNSVMTANGILIAGGSDGNSGSPTSSSDAPSPTGTNKDDKKPASGSGSPKFDARAPETLTFAKTAILYALQASQDMSVAIAAQSALQTFLTKPKNGDPKKVDVGSGFIVDFVGGSITGTKGGAVGKGVERGG